MKSIIATALVGTAAVAASGFALSAAAPLRPSGPECPSTTQNTDEILVQFAGFNGGLERQVPGLNPLTASEARPLTGSRDEAACAYFNERFARAIARKQPDGTPHRYYAYYKWRGYYITIGELRPSSDPDVVTIGRDRVAGWTEDFEQVAGV